MTDDLINLLKQYHEVIVYGAGKIGSIVVRWIRKNIPETEIVVAVSDNSAKIQICEGIEAQCISDLFRKNDSVPVLIAAQPLFQGTMKYIAIEAGYKNLHLIDNKMCNRMSRDVFSFKQNLLQTVQEIPYRFLFCLVKLCPLKNSIVFSSHTNGRDGSCETVYRYMCDNGLNVKYKVVWIVNKSEKYRNTKQCKYIDSKKMKSLRNMFYMGTSKYLIWENIALMKVRAKQKSIHITHGMPTIKDVHGLINIPEETDAVLISSENVVELQSYQMCMDKEKYVVCGLPRIDELFRNCDELEKLNLKGTKTIIWMPTFRKLFYSSREDAVVKGETGIPLLENEGDIRRLNLELRKRNLNLIIKIHPMQELSKINVCDCTNICVVTNDMIEEKQINLYSLLGETCALVSDYSSVVFDYLMLDRPMAFVLDDMEQYSRGFAIENIYDFMPGEKLFAMEDFISFLDNVAMGKDEYKLQRQVLRDYCHKYQDSKNSERFWNILEEL